MSIATPGDRLFSMLQRLLPTRLLSRGMYGLTRIRWQPFKNLLIRLFMRGFGMTLAEAEVQDITAFPDFNAFFTRALRADQRPLAAAPAVLSPVDGTLSQFGPMTAGRLVQAKGHDYACAALLADADDAGRFVGGDFATIYLAPFNYHRIHMPMAGQLIGWRYIPGRLFSVNASTARAMPGLFARNERLVTLFEGDTGPFAMILVGALVVAGIDTVWAGEVAPMRPRLQTTDYRQTTEITLKKGDEMGRFKLGSTVILLFPQGKVSWDAELANGSPTRMGESIGTLAGG